MSITLFNFKKVIDPRGILVAAEEHSEIPFEIKRVYFIMENKENIPRGFHAHKKLKQVLTCLKGSCKVLLDDGESRQEILLSDPAEGLLVDAMYWHEMHEFSEDCILAVFASDKYNETDYIRDYDEFMSVSGRKSLHV